MNVSARRCVCFEHAGSRECYELRTYGRSPILRSDLDHSEAMYMVVDPYGDCECACHADDEYEDDL